MSEQNTPRINDEIVYKGEKQIIAYIIPEFDGKGKRQANGNSVYLSPANKIVSIRSLNTTNQ